MSVRDDPVLFLQSGKAGSGGTVAGGAATTTTRPHKLDGAEHTAAEDTTRLDASVDRHGLMAKLTGDVDDLWRGDGTWAPGAGVNVLDDLADVAISAPVAGDRLRFDGSGWVNSPLRWEPHVSYDGSVVLDGNGNPVMHEVSY